MTNDCTIDYEIMEKKAKRSIICGFLLLPVGLLLLRAFVLTNHYNFMIVSSPILIGSGIQIIINYNKRRNKQECSYAPFWTGLIVGILLLFFFSSSIMFLYIDSNQAWRYPIQKAYLEKRVNSFTEPDWFNEIKKEDIKGGYYFYYSPHFYGGHGGDSRFDVRFIAEPQTAQRYAEKYAEIASYSYSVKPMKDTKVFACYNADGEEEDFVSDMDYSFWSDTSSAKVYYCGQNNEGSGSSWKYFVMVDTVSGKIEFCQKG